MLFIHRYSLKYFSGEGDLRAPGRPYFVPVGENGDICIYERQSSAHSRAAAGRLQRRREDAAMQAWPQAGLMRAAVPAKPSGTV